MFRNKVMVKVDPPVSVSVSPFLLVQIHLRSPDPNPDPLCWSLSRSLHLACFLLYPSTLALVYKRNQEGAAREALERIEKSLSIQSVEEEEELSSQSVAAKAVECVLKARLLNSGWSCVGNSCFVSSSFCSDDETKPLLAFNVSVQSDRDGSFVFLVSPDVIRFNRFKMTNLVGSKMSKTFDDGEEIIPEDFNFVTSCSSLPSLKEGCVIGVRKLLPAGEDLLRFQDIWSSKHGLNLPSEYFIKVQWYSGISASPEWFPSAFVLQGSGFSPAPQSVRISKSVEVLQSFMTCIEAWNFCGQGALKAKGISTLTIGSELLSWTRAVADSKSSTTNDTSSFNKKCVVNLLSNKDFRSPKPPLICGSTTVSEKSPRQGSTDISDARAHECATASEISNAAIQSFVQVSPVINPSHPGDMKSQVFKPRFSRRLQSKQMESSENANGGPIQRKTEISLKDISNIPCQDRRLLPRRKGKNICQTQKTKPEDIVPEGASKTNIEVVNQDISGDSRPSKENVNSVVPFDNYLSVNCTRKIEANIKTRKRTSLKEDKSKDDLQSNMTKKRVKPQCDPSNNTSKVLDHHERAQLEALTVAELKCFLSSKQAKVGGKKQELIDRISALLSK